MPALRSCIERLYLEVFPVEKIEQQFGEVRKYLADLELLTYQHGKIMLLIILKVFLALLTEEKY